jgi:hypothetical protein
MSRPGDTATLHFVPWLRAGATSVIATADPLQGPLPASAALAPWVRISGRTLPVVPLQASLHGPGHVQALAAHTVVRVEPPAGTPDFEPNYFPYVELRPADLPWRYTPAGNGERAQLRPWLVLVVVRQQPGVQVAVEPGVALPVLSIDPGQGAIASRELPDLADSAAWAHVQSVAPPAQLAAALAADPAAATARLLCPRRLQEKSSWYACLVPAFEIGRRTGLGESVAGSLETAPAWDFAVVDEGPVRLPVYFHWTFATADNGDFEALARRLEPENDAVLGRVDLDVTNPGPPLPRAPAGKPVRGSFVGALKTPGVERKALPADHQAWLDRGLEPLLERGAQRPTVPASAPAGYDPGRDDPVVAPPLYGSFQADRFDVPASTDRGRAWMRPLNLDPQLRVLAGLGARVVRASQEALLASAWAQAGALRETAQALAGAHLAIEVGRSLARRIARWDRGSVVQAARPALAWVPSPASTDTLAADLWQSAVPRGLVGAAFARAARARTALGRAWGRRPAPAGLGVLARTATGAFLDATGATAPPDLRAALGFAATRLAAGAWTHDDALGAAPSSPAARTIPRDYVAHTSLAASATRFGPLVGPRGTRFDGTAASLVALVAELTGSPVLRATRPPVTTLDLSGAGQAIVSALDPRPRVQSGLLRRVPALASVLVADAVLPRRLSLAPVFTDSLCWDVVKIDARLLLPGADTLANNRVALLAADNAYVAAFLAGANHEMGRELLWREFPASPGATFFRRFWDTGPEGPDDIGDMRTWTRPELGANVTGISAGALSVVLVRGDLVRRYPEAHIFLVRAVWEDDEAVPDPAQTEEAVLQGALDSRSVFLGFPVAVAAMRGDRTATARTPDTAGWFVAIEEPSTGPRFGLDRTRRPPDLTAPGATWQDLAWRHLLPPGGKAADLSHAVARTPLPAPLPQTLDGLTWGHNAAHMAAITWQRPFRLYIHADQLLPGERAPRRSEP